MRWSPALLFLLISLPPAASASSVPDLVGMELLSESLQSIQGDALRLRSSMFEGRIAMHSPEAVLLPEAVPDLSSYPVRGIDVSHYQEAIDWKQVAEAGISFAYIKATEGTDLADDMFARNWKGAAGAGVARGAYHFYNFCAGGAAQGDFFVKTVPADPGTLPPVVDLERSGSCPKLPSRASFRKSLAAFTAKLKAAYGRAPVIYTNAEIYSLYLAGDSADYRIWFVDIRNGAPQIPEDRPWTFWQYSFKGRIPGIDGPVDLDVYREGPVELAALLRGEPDTLLALR